jgi:hypothetical protein
VGPGKKSARASGGRSAGAGLGSLRYAFDQRRSGMVVPAAPGALDFFSAGSRHDGRLATEAHCRGVAALLSRLFQFRCRRRRPCLPQLLLGAPEQLGRRRTKLRHHPGDEIAKFPRHQFSLAHALAIFPGHVLTIAAEFLPSPQVRSPSRQPGNEPERSTLTCKWKRRRRRVRLPYPCDGQLQGDANAVSVLGDAAIRHDGDGDVVEGMRADARLRIRR